MNLLKPKERKCRVAAYILQKTKHVKRKKKRRNTLSVKYSGKPIQTVG
jgi:hypothetical protein